MADIDTRLAALGVQRPRVQLPRLGVDLFKWSVIACDQHTSNPQYWQQVESEVDDEPSSLRLVFPEVYLGALDEEQRIHVIKNTMQQYVRDGILTERAPEFVLVRRQTKSGSQRDGLLLAVDLERYDFAPEAETLIRATEGTILERIPPRVRIREGAALELPHIMLLIDDPEDSVIGEVVSQHASLDQLYDTDLMLGGGHVTGFAVDKPGLVEHLTRSFETIAAPDHSGSRYGIRTSLLFAVGDGNHSLATAKRVWENLKAAGVDPQSHPARHALVEVVNIHSVPFEPIHRVVFGVNRELIAMALSELFAEPPRTAGSREEALGIAHAASKTERRVALLGRDQSQTVRLAGSGLVHAEVQRTLEENLPPQAEVDYVHGEREAARLVAEEGAAAVVLPPFDRSALFREVVHHGPLPRKVFSMGHAEDKRYYMEARAITAKA